jgi:negative regulator of flagellin synthesis FlgM
MKINPALDPNAKDIADRLARAATSPASASSGASSAIEATAAGEKIHLSGTSQAMTELYSEPFDAAKVAAIRKAISEGRFSVNAERVADRLISDSAELLGRIFGDDHSSRQ